MIRAIKYNDNFKLNLKSIKGFEAFSRIYQNARKFHAENISIAYIKPEKVKKVNFNLEVPVIVDFVNFNTDNILKIDVYFGVTIAKKNCKKAVVRNRIKRLLREAVAQYFLQSESTNKDINTLYNKFHNAHFVLSARYKLTSPSQIHLKDIQPEVTYLINQILKHS